MTPYNKNHPLHPDWRMPKKPSTPRGNLIKFVIFVLMVAAYLILL